MVAFIEKNPNLRFTTITCGDITLEVRLLNLDGKDVVIGQLDDEYGTILDEQTDYTYYMSDNAEQLDKQIYAYVGDVEFLQMDDEHLCEWVKDIED